MRKRGLSNLILKFDKDSKVSLERFIDTDDNELASMELIHLFVETLDKYFGSVCELDVVYNFYKVYTVLDELLVGGEIVETSKMNILKKLREIEFYE